MENVNFIQELFGNIDFTKITDDENFKEDSVREIIIHPILKKLGYKDVTNIIRAPKLQNPFRKYGSNNKYKVLFPDYAIKIGEYYAWVLDAKRPSEKIVNDENVEQVYSYATHPEINCKYFALCNGIEFSLFKTSDPASPILYFKMEEIESHWKLLEKYLSINSFQTSNEIKYREVVKYQKEFDYKNRPPLKEIPVKKQAAKRHYGVHGYFTSQSWNVVQEYIKNFSQHGDLVLDPFGGRGVTAVEAMMTERKTIHIDINPMSVFLVESLIAPINTTEFANAFEEIKIEYKKNEPKTDEEIEKALKKYKLPKDLLLPKSSDVDSVLKLFSKQQLAQLSLLKSIIKKQKNKNIQKTLMLMFSGLVTKTNLTYHDSSTRDKNAGNASAFVYYRYRIAPVPIILDIMKVFEIRYKKILNAKKEIEYYINEHTIDNIDVRKGTATDLSFIENESIDYIYTDPPYGNKIPYLDLSTMWNAWLDFDVSEEDYELEAIEGGTHNKSKQSYKDLIAKSIQEMYRVLKFDRWLSFVFAHKDPEFWHLIVDTAESCGFEYMGAVPQKNGKSSFKKTQHPFTVLSGQLIINFRKTLTPRTIMQANLGMTTAQIIEQAIEGIIAKENGATIEQINNELILKGLELGFLHHLKKEYTDLTPVLSANKKLEYDSVTGVYTLRKGKKFDSDIPLDLRIRFYLISYLREKEREGIHPTLEDVVHNVMPLLKNGSTPDRQTIESELKKLAVHVGKDGWKLNDGELF